MDFDELSTYLSYASNATSASVVKQEAHSSAAPSKPTTEVKNPVSKAPEPSSTSSTSTSKDAKVAKVAAPVVSSSTSTNESKSKEVTETKVVTEGDGKDSSGEKFYDPVTGEQISKNMFKKIQKGTNVKKEKKVDKPVATTEDGEKKEKKEKKVKEPEVIYTDKTPDGEKKILDGIFPPTYQPKYVEAAWQSWWEKQGFYKPNVDHGIKAEAKDKFIMVIPPPNVTGTVAHHFISNFLFIL